MTLIILLQYKSTVQENKQEEKGLITENTSTPLCLSNQTCFTGPIDGVHKLPLAAEKDPLQSSTSELNSKSFPEYFPLNLLPLYQSVSQERKVH